MNNFTVAI
jgi:hypothetical protein